MSSQNKNTPKLTKQAKFDRDIRTEESLKRAKRIVEVFEKGKESPRDAETRAQHLECTYCFHISGRVAGQAVTDYVCWDCHRDFSHPDTRVPRLCRVCAESLELCRRCMAPMD